MIEFARSYKAGDGRCYATLEEAQVIELQTLLSGNSGISLEAVKFIVNNKDAIVNILTLNDSSRPKARGMKKPRKAKAEVLKLDPNADQ